ncbi:MAG: hypothetical protein F7B18_07015 [Desulfurococcales archaeon]|nr:hypothetical protein [Desulfurococcales archaeon]
MIILVVGLYPESSGKTVMASSLVSALLREGIEAFPFKPVGGTDVWISPWALRESRRLRVLATGDALALRRPVERAPVELVNPLGFHILPLDPERVSWRIRDILGVQGLARRIGLARATFCRGRNVHSVHLFNPDALRRAPKSLEKEVMEVAGSLMPIPLRAGDEAMENILAGQYVDEVDQCLFRVSGMSDVVVVESNSNIAAPTRATARPDLVVAVSPGTAYLVDGDRFSKAIELVALAGKPWSVDSGEALALAGYMDSINLPLLEDPMEGYGADLLNPIIDKVKRFLGGR